MVRYQLQELNEQLHEQWHLTEHFILYNLIGTLVLELRAVIYGSDLEKFNNAKEIEIEGPIEFKVETPEKTDDKMAKKG